MRVAVMVDAIFVSRWGDEKTTVKYQKSMSNFLHHKYHKKVRDNCQTLSKNHCQFSYKTGTNNKQEGE